MYSKGPASAAMAPPGWAWSGSRMSWGAVLAGVAVALATSLLLSLLGAALGAVWFHPVDLWNDFGRLSIGTVLWQIANIALSMLLGGYIAARLSGSPSHHDGELHGMTMWAVTTLVGCLIGGLALGGLAATVGQSLGAVVGRALGESEAASRLVPAELNMRAVADRLRHALASGGDDLTSMNREQIGAEVGGLVQRSLAGDLSDQDRDRLAALVAADSGVTREEAVRRVLRLVADARASRAQLEQKAQAAADAVAEGAAATARALFTGVTAGLLASLVGAWLGIRHKRMLHPELAQEAYATTGYGGRASAYGTSATRAAYGRGEPVGTSVRDDARARISQHLGGVTFPATRQELLRAARSGPPDAELLRAIERLPERSYASAREVMEALGMAHAS